MEVASSVSVGGGGAFAVLEALDFLRFLFEESFSALDSWRRFSTTGDCGWLLIDSFLGWYR
jgi:hypothetical protein